tara:strand:- start:443 stop:694 length:252 start_codon:yes stop_codon:yes gene_type:complete
MKLIFLLIIILFAFIFVFKNFKKFSKPEKIFKLNKKNFYTWMNLSKKKRYELAKKNSVFYLKQRKNLLKQIQNEYKNISHSEK